jgi:hypothetical protein
MKTEMDKFKAGTLHSGSPSGPKVTNRKQAIAIGISEAHKAGGPAPKGKPKKLTAGGKGRKA